MVITALGVTLLFASLGLATALMAAVHDAIEAWLQRRQFRLRRAIGGGEGGVPVAAPSPRRAAHRSRRAPSPTLAANAASKSTYTVEPSPTPAWLDNARRDIVHAASSTKAPESARP